MRKETALALGALLALPTALAATVVFIRRSFCIVNVSGTSMYPALRDGERLLVRRSGVAGLRHGDIVVAASPRISIEDRSGIEIRHLDWRCGGRKWIVKRAAYLAGDEIPQAWSGPASGSARTVPDGYVFLLGDNGDESLDSRYFGCVPLDAVLGVACSL